MEKGKSRFLSYKEARSFIRNDVIKFKITGARKWEEYCKSGMRHKNIPSMPSRSYKNKGWINWAHWLRLKNNKMNDRKKYRINEDFFKTWSSNMAYVLGFWFTDGYISSDGTIFSIAQHKKDEKILKDISKAMWSNYPLHIKALGNSREICIRSSVIVKDIVRLGGVPRKSLIMDFPHVPKKYLSDFIRGLWDGDGSIFMVKRIKSYMSGYECGSKPFIYALHNILKQNINGLKGRIACRYFKKGDICFKKIRSKDSESYALHFGVNDTRRLASYIYKNKNGLKMSRKFKKFNDVGNIRLSPKDSVFWDFKKARHFVRKKKFKTVRHWLDYCRSGEKPARIPSNPDTYYKNEGWKSWADWHGKKDLKKQKI